MPSPHFLWVTRSSPYAFLTGHHLRAAGHEPLIAPVLTIHRVSHEPLTKPPDALVFTSTHGVAHHLFDPEMAEVPVYAVGQRTARTARDAGYRNVASADGNVGDLYDLIIARAARGSSIVHLGAAEPAGNLARDLVGQGFSARHVAVYESLDVPSSTLRPALAALPWIDGVLVHSPKAGRRLARFLMECGDLWHGTAFCISHAAAEPISAVTRAPVLVAQFPTENALIALVGESGKHAPSTATARA
ncbi:uroporphyrinogen-III synthase [Tardibacter chloracetimidivorans]|uniref:Uroporphyrinogen-III synthase n=1 Tax=Tardibacter chloracetimidivorans TaxID=1921510 RepID=A0A1L3ZSZ1_9SPHN|nr:uroporphyrinogen-III synthase [Tardibacter chloracetimidivorans]API58756.1 uroporphyrinogen-III synthase [Tardibacter chloracetimidivorans]